MAATHTREISRVEEDMFEIFGIDWQGDKSSLESDEIEAWMYQEKAKNLLSSLLFKRMEGYGKVAGKRAERIQDWGVNPHESEKLPL